MGNFESKQAWSPGPGTVRRPLRCVSVSFDEPSPGGASVCVRERERAVQEGCVSSLKMVKECMVVGGEDKLGGCGLVYHFLEEFYSGVKCFCFSGSYHQPVYNRDPWMCCAVPLSTLLTS